MNRRKAARQGAIDGLEMSTQCLGGQRRLRSRPAQRRSGKRNRAGRLDTGRKR